MPEFVLQYERYILPWPEFRSHPELANLRTWEKFGQYYAFLSARAGLNARAPTIFDAFRTFHAVPSEDRASLEHPAVFDDTAHPFRTPSRTSSLWALYLNYASQSTYRKNIFRYCLFQGGGSQHSFMTIKIGSK
jgi:hypothetical protein